MQDLKSKIIEQLNLQDLTPADIGDDQPLFVQQLDDLSQVILDLIAG